MSGRLCGVANPSTVDIIYQLGVTQDAATQARWVCQLISNLRGPNRKNMGQGSLPGVWAYYKESKEIIIFSASPAKFIRKKGNFETNIELIVY